MPFKVSSWLSSQVSPISLIGVRQVLSVAGWWVMVVSTVQDQTLGPSGPRFKGRDATLLHRLIRPPVVGEPAQAGIASGPGVSVGPARPVVHLKTEVLEGQEPSCHPGVGVFDAGHPFQGCVFGDQGELPP